MRAVVLGMIIAALILPAGVPALAQDGGEQSCSAIFQAALTGMMAHCFGQSAGIACAASGDVLIEMASGQVVSGPGSAARISGVAAIRAQPAEAWSIASVYAPDMLDPQKYAALLLFGPSSVEFQHDASLPDGAIFTLTNAAAPAPCADLAMPGVLVQSPENSLTLLRVNGTDLAINGMAAIRANDDGSLTVSALSRETILGQSGTVIFAGYSAQAQGEVASAVTPYDPAQVGRVPTQILPKMDVIPLPGNAMVQQEMNLFSRPDPAAYTNTMVKAGLPVSVLGRNSAGDFLNIRTYDGALGWFPASALQVNVPGDMPVYDTNPPTPIRPFGSIQAYLVTKEELNNLRAGPGEQYDIVATVPLWTELALYGRSPDDQWLLVEMLDTGLRAWINVVLISASTPFTLSELPYPPEFGG
jgi:hypothetical protein